MAIYFLKGSLVIETKFDFFVIAILDSCITSYNDCGINFSEPNYYSIDFNSLHFNLFNSTLENFNFYLGY